MGVVVDALKSLWIKGRLRGDDELVAGIGDIIEAGPKAAGRGVIDEAWPGTAVATLDTWHRTLGVTYDQGLSVAEQQVFLASMLTAKPGSSFLGLQDQIQKVFPGVSIQEVSATSETGVAECGVAQCDTPEEVVSATTYTLVGTIPTEADTFRLTSIIRRYGPAHMIPTSNLTLEEDDVLNECGAAICGVSFCDGEAQVASAPLFALSPYIAGSAEPGRTLYVYTPGVTGVPTPELSYQWQLDGVDIVGGNSDRLVVPSVGSYTCEVTATNSEGSEMEETAPSVTPDVAPVISSASLYLSGSSLYISMAYTGRPDPSFGYQWRKDGADIVGQNGASLDLTGRTPGSYQCFITATNSAGVGSLLSGAYVATAPAITWDGIIASRLVAAGSLREFYLTASLASSGVPAPSVAYAWYLDGSPLSPYIIPGSPAQSPVIPSGVTGSVHLVVTASNLVGSTNQTSNTLTI